MSELKRYDLEIGEEVNIFLVEMTPAADGEWCRYEDVMAYIGQIHDELKEIAARQAKKSTSSQPQR